jgi:hypothetical protein
MRLGFAPFRGSNPRASAAPGPFPRHARKGPNARQGRRLQFTAVIAKVWSGRDGTFGPRPDGGARRRWPRLTAQRRAAEAHAAVHVLDSSVEAFRHAAEAHERAASMHDRTAAAGIGDARGHEQQAALHRSAAAAHGGRQGRRRRPGNLLPGLRSPLILGSGSTATGAKPMRDDNYEPNRVLGIPRGTHHARQGEEPQRVMGMPVDWFADWFGPVDPRIQQSLAHPIRAYRRWKLRWRLGPFAPDEDEAD